jgi:hypothetical protein
MLPGRKQRTHIGHTMVRPARFGSVITASSGDVDPLAPESYAVMAALRLPIDIGDDRAVGVGAAWPLPAFEAVEPWLERRVSVATVITGDRVSGEKDGRDQQRNDNPEEIHAAISATKIFQGFYSENVRVE